MKIESGLCGGEVLHHEFSKLCHDQLTKEFIKYYSSNDSLKFSLRSSELQHYNELLNENFVVGM